MKPQTAATSSLADEPIAIGPANESEVTGAVSSGTGAAGAGCIDMSASERGKSW